MNYKTKEFLSITGYSRSKTIEEVMDIWFKENLNIKIINIDYVIINEKTTRAFILYEIIPNRIIYKVKEFSSVGYNINEWFENNQNITLVQIKYAAINEKKSKVLILYL